MIRKYLLSTLGCKVNQYESQHLRALLESHGLRPAFPGETADVAVVNTCAVTAAASRKTRQTIRRLSPKGTTPVFVVGCGATADGNQLRELNGVTAVIGHDGDAHGALRQWLSDRFPVAPAHGQRIDRDASAAKSRSDVNGHEVLMKPAVAQPRRVASTSESPDLSLRIMSTPPGEVKANGVLLDRIDSFAGHQRAFLKIQDGCDAFCTYCIIPQLRPALRSKPIEVAVAEAEAFVRAGHKEIILTGIFLGSYGRDTAIRKRWGTAVSPLARLVNTLARVDGLHRLRLSSLEPGDVDDALLDVLASHDCCVPHLHLPLQSGSEGILRRMNRQYTCKEFQDMIDRVRDRLDRPAISTDIIVGFPGETEAEFEASLATARYAEFCKVHAFPFSPRERTAAARWTGQFVPGDVVRKRMGRLAEVERECSLSFRRRFLGTVERVIVERDGPNGRDGNGRRPSDGGSVSHGRGSVFHGRGDRYFEIHFEIPRAEDSTDGRVAAPGDVVLVRIDRVTPTRTHGVLVHG